jgi:uncharacterized protein (TIGR00661 family)
MRIVYGVHGYGWGHATRALGVLPDLMRRHEVLVLAGGDAHRALAAFGPVTRIPTLTYVYGAGGSVEVVGTLRDNASRVYDVLGRGETYRRIARLLVDFRPDIAICDVDPWTHRIAEMLRIPRISFDHFGILAYCRPPMAWRDRLRCLRDIGVYRLLTGTPDRVIVSSFYEAPARFPGARCVGALLRDAAFGMKAERGDYLLAYFNKGSHQYTPRIESALHPPSFMAPSGAALMATSSIDDPTVPRSSKLSPDAGRCSARRATSWSARPFTSESLFWCIPNRAWSNA